LFNEVVLRPVTALVALGLAIAAASATAASPGPAVVDRTLSCPVPAIAQALSVGARVKRAAYQDPGGAGVTTFNYSLTYVAVPRFLKQGNGFVNVPGTVFDSTVCRPASQQIRLSHAGLHARWVMFNGGHWVNVTWRCAMTGYATVRMRATIAKSGWAVAATIVLASGGTTRAYIDWTPTLVHVWMAPSCTQETP
jgi:hypothetical protein